MGQCRTDEPFRPCDGCAHQDTGAYVQRGPVWLCSRCDDELRDQYRTGLSFDELRVANVARCEASFHELDACSPTDWACALAGEVGELCNLLKKRHRGDPVDPRDIRREAGDVVAYLDLLAARLGIDLGEATRAKFNEVSERVGSSITL